ncbi:TraB/GumN family protein [Sandarakinorhabdus oryzae]|uniref:TraB/GumN family protein n=1 Tax=Sandarakinorhabdus oryzae TaxID=2675220 RepID=UPI0018CC47C9|nr:TraB/GumN family protein [Sandarakinorhabdus oryzae]
MTLPKPVLQRLLILLCLWLAAPAWAIPAMWQVGNGRSQVTIYGTIHALPKGTDWFTPRARTAFTKADTLVVEMVAPEQPGAMADVVQQIGMLPAPVPIRDRLPEEQRARYDAMVKASNLPLAGLDGMKSWLAAISLVQIEMLTAGIDPAAGVDVTLISRARAAKKQLVGLETPRGQLELFNSLPEAEQRLLLASAISDSGEGGKQMQALVAAWLAGDVARILKDFDDASLSPELEARLFTNRNKAWADWVQAALKRPGRRFMAVGAAHMAGPHGLIALLKARGLRVKRVE